MDLQRQTLHTRVKYTRGDKDTVANNEGRAADISTQERRAGSQKAKSLYTDVLQY